MIDVNGIRTSKKTEDCILRVLLYMKDENLFCTFPPEDKLEGALKAIRGEGDDDDRPWDPEAISAFLQMKAMR